jgi:hypothetical protein
MTEDNSKPDQYEALRRYVPLAIWAIVFLVLLFIPLKVIKYGYLPGDDALRHAAKAVSGKDWRDILVLGPAFHFDPNWGWHWFLRQFHLGLHWDAAALVVFAVVMLYVVTNWSIVAVLKRPEAWLAALILISLVSDLTSRFLLGRPFVLSIVVEAVFLLVWQRRWPGPPKWQDLCWMTPLIAIAVFLHGCWYLWAIPIAAFFLAQQFRWCFVFAISWVLGTLLGSALTGHPVESIVQILQLAFRAVGIHPTQATIVEELKPTGGDIFTLIFLGGLIVLRQLTRLNVPPLVRNPMFWMVALGWVLGCQTGRFWEDWGAPALMVLLAADLQALFELQFAADSFKRLALVAALAVTCYAVTTTDANSRWTNHLGWRYLTTDNPDLNGWLPEPGGVFYSADMSLFYQTFYKNPNADWRYALGFESSLMTDDNFKVYHSILWNFGDSKAYLPWADKMLPPDRLVIRGARNGPPNIPQLEWYYGVGGIWIGRVPRPVEPGTASPTVPATAH